MFYLYKAYLTSREGAQILILTHDVKRCLVESKLQAGHINIVSTQATTAISLMENDPVLQGKYLKYLQKQFEADDHNKVARRSGAGLDRYHLMAAQVGLSITISIDQGRLLISPFHEIVAFDFEPQSGRREFIMTAVGEGGGK